MSVYMERQTEVIQLNRDVLIRKEYQEESKKSL